MEPDQLFQYDDLIITVAQIARRGGPLWVATPVNMAEEYAWARGYGITIDDAAADLLRLRMQIRLRLAVPIA